MTDGGTQLPPRERPGMFRSWSEAALYVGCWLAACDLLIASVWWAVFR